jgi:hypothetical protein
MWLRCVVDVGITGPDKGQGGRYLILSSGDKGSVPHGEFHQPANPQDIILASETTHSGRLITLPRPLPTAGSGR